VESRERWISAADLIAAIGPGPACKGGRSEAVAAGVLPAAFQPMREKEIFEGKRETHASCANLI
jgi:hypothetical protein